MNSTIQTTRYQQLY